MNSPDRQKNALQIIFAIFLGLMLVAFIGIGVWTFYPQPEWTDNPQLETEIRTLETEQTGIYNKLGNEGGELTPADEARLAEIDKELADLYDQREMPMQDWGRNTSIILIAFATVVMAVSLTQADQLKVLSNGLLLGGIFTMMYGTGWAVATGTSMARFWVVAVALVITIVLGYLRFVRGERDELELALDAEGVAALGPELNARVSELERKLGGLANVLSQDQR